MKIKTEPRTPNAHRRFLARVRAVDPPAPQTASHPRTLSDLSPLYAINDRCLQLLVEAARTDQPGAFPLVAALGDLLRDMTPETRARAARRPLLLVDLHFANGEWWRIAKDHPSRPAPLSAWRGAFPRAPGIHLARATLLLAWHTAHAAPHEASLIGMTANVSDAIAELPITEIHSVADKRFKHVRPRWEDRPAVWRRLLVSAKSEDIRRARDFSLYGVQLLTAELIAAADRSRTTS